MTLLVNKFYYYVDLDTKEVLKVYIDSIYDMHSYIDIKFITQDNKELITRYKHNSMRYNFFNTNPPYWVIYLSKYDLYSYHYHYHENESCSIEEINRIFFLKISSYIRRKLNLNKILCL